MKLLFLLIFPFVCAVGLPWIVIGLIMSSETRQDLGYWLWYIGFGLIFVGFGIALGILGFLFRNPRKD